MNVWYVVLIIAAYFIGSIPFGVIVGRSLFGIDPRKVGSGNIGAANALRAMGFWGAILTLAGDVFKGIVPTAIAVYVLHAPPLVVAAVGLATIIGHTWSIFLHFEGGKGVATGLGVLVVLSFWAALVWAIVFLTTALTTRFASLSSILATASAPIALLLLHAPWPYVVYAVISLALVLWRHQANIGRLISGVEPRIGQKTSQGAS
ncbi:MAG: glycerol-3-phosphate 1-O-acyltransferase PlsY [Candidatus Eremiobacteraeota bacterium]|nr:glycerol-3-phosphate 1-O-acyltransferase PlsY [Candidatus Eremiobacteraeota bacterium]MBV8366983.1 glycerol-3-phosphate 1-O-acyltransferase PlsY [Candidatus Eremiobacteraeota bacterium]